MKNILVVLTVAALCGAAHAITTYEYSNANYALYGTVAAYENDPYPGKGQTGYYTCYCLTQGTAQNLVGSGSTVTYQTLATWLGEGFLTASRYDDLKKSSDTTVVSKEWESKDNRYLFQNSVIWGPNPGDNALVVCVYDDTGFIAFNSFASTPDAGHQGFNVTASSPNSGWQTMQIPEPTGGALALVAFALLALRRRNKLIA